MHPNLELIMPYIGWGDPDGGLWSIAIEESMPWTEGEISSFIESLHLREGVRYRRALGEAAADGRSRLPFWQSMIAAQLSASTPAQREFRQRCLWRDNSGTFHSNLWPVGKATLNQRPDFESLFGLKELGWDGYFAEMRSSRFPLIQGFWKEHARPAATVCYGKSHWYDFERLFEVASKPEPSGQKDRIRVAAIGTQLIVLAPHWSNQHGLKPSEAHRIAGLLVDWGVRIP